VAVCTSLADAKAVLDDSIGLIACGVHFDDGRMFDLLRYVKADPRLRSIPFFGIVGAGRELSPAILGGIRTAAATLGAAGLVDLAGLKNRIGEPQAYELLRGELRERLSE
jgi:hypothetical protein